MRFLVDNSMSPRLAAGLREQGHDAVHVRDLGLAQASDEIIFDAAGREQRIIVAQDTDFGTLLAMKRERFPSVILFRCQVKSNETLFKLLTANLSAVQADLTAGAIVVIEDARIRVRHLPLLGT